MTVFVFVVFFFSPLRMRIYRPDSSMEDTAAGDFIANI
jgi:hypothetical protein